jgi:transcriptional regulator with XRE-family HTH domain
VTDGGYSIPRRVSHCEIYACGVRGSAFAPVEVPASAWRAGSVRDALCGRDVAALLRLVQGHCGVSQARLAAAVGMGQGRLNEIVNGRRGVTQFAVFERIADGLAMPDEARVLMGLAPAHAARGVFTGHAEIARVFRDQAEANAELTVQAANAGQVDLLAVRALGLIALNDSLLRGPLSRRTEPVRVRVLLLDPESPMAAARAAEIGESLGSFTAGVRLALARLAEFADDPVVRVQVAVHGELPVWRMLRFDDVLYLSAFGLSAEGHRSGMYKFTAAANGVLHGGFLRQFDAAWQQARRV